MTCASLKSSVPPQFGTGIDLRFEIYWDFLLGAEEEIITRLYFFRECFLVSLCLVAIIVQEISAIVEPIFNFLLRIPVLKNSSWGGILDPNNYFSFWPCSKVVLKMTRLPRSLVRPHRTRLPPANSFVILHFILLLVVSNYGSGSHIYFFWQRSPVELITIDSWPSDTLYCVLTARTQGSSLRKRKRPFPLSLLPTVTGSTRWQETVKSLLEILGKQRRGGG